VTGTVLIPLPIVPLVPASTVSVKVSDWIVDAGPIDWKGDWVTHAPALQPPWMPQAIPAGAGTWRTRPLSQLSIVHGLPSLTSVQVGTGVQTWPSPVVPVGQGRQTASVVAVQATLSNVPDGHAVQAAQTASLVAVQAETMKWPASQLEQGWQPPSRRR
jgi:hypothetical protein